MSERITLNESIIEDATLTWFSELGYAIGHGPDMAPDEPASERESFGDMVLMERLRYAIRRLSPIMRSDTLRTAPLQKLMSEEICVQAIQETAGASI